VLGVFASGLLEPLFVFKLTLSHALAVGFIEEASKIAGIVLLTRKRRHYSPLEGLILGAASGMGFASFESNGYAFVTFFQSGGSLTAMVLVTLLRGVLSPIGHGTWTAILGSVLFRERQERGFVFNRRVIGTYVLVSILHALWNSLPMMVTAQLGTGLDVLVAQVSLGVFSILLLWRQWLRAIELPLAHVAQTCE
jgi:protease PrsW